MRGKPAQDWNMPVSEAMYVLSVLQKRDDLALTDQDRAAIGAGRMALVKFLPGERDRVTEDMTANALRVCPQAVQDAMAGDAPARVAWMLQCGLSTFVSQFNKYRSPPIPSRRRPGGR